jgi:hypothetical protein
VLAALGPGVDVLNLRGDVRPWCRGGRVICNVQVAYRAH